MLGHNGYPKVTNRGQTLIDKVRSQAFVASQLWLGKAPGLGLTTGSPPRGLRIRAYPCL